MFCCQICFVIFRFSPLSFCRSGETQEVQWQGLRRSAWLCCWLLPDNQTHHNDSDRLILASSAQIWSFLKCVLKSCCHLYQTVHISSRLVVCHQEEPEQFLHVFSQSWSVSSKSKCKRKTIEGSIEIKVVRESGWRWERMGSFVETWKGIRFVSNKRSEVGRPTIWFGKSQILQLISN